MGHEPPWRGLLEGRIRFSALNMWLFFHPFFFTSNSQSRAKSAANISTTFSPQQASETNEPEDAVR